MAASVHNLILSWNELNIIQGVLDEVCHMRTDGNTIRELMSLRKKIANQRDEGYPSKNYPFWRNYFEETKLKDVLVTEEQVYDFLGEDSDGDAVEMLANLASGTYTLENLQKDILE